MSTKRSINRLTRKQIFDFLKFMQNNRERLEFLGNQEGIQTLASAGLPLIGRGTYENLRKDLGWSARRLTPKELKGERDFGRRVSILEIKIDRIIKELGLSIPDPIFGAQQAPEPPTMAPAEGSAESA